jgi:hypothetical protein
MPHRFLVYSASGPDMGHGPRDGLPVRKSGRHPAFTLPQQRQGQRPAGTNRAEVVPHSTWLTCRSFRQQKRGSSKAPASPLGGYPCRLQTGTRSTCMA